MEQQVFYSHAFDVYVVRVGVRLTNYRSVNVARTGASHRQLQEQERGLKSLNRNLLRFSNIFGILNKVTLSLNHLNAFFRVFHKYTELAIMAILASKTLLHEKYPAMKCYPSKY